MTQIEQVLVVETKVVEQVGMFQGLAFDVDRYLPELFAPGVAHFMPRPDAEKNPAFKQLIPYVIICHDQKVLSYVRGKRAGEKRLTGLRSIGIGGHINPIDVNTNLFNTDFYQTVYRPAVEREIEEEIAIDAQHTDQIVALLNDDSNEVGSVHLGVVHLWNLDAPHVEKREQMITQLTFMTLAELEAVRDTCETWSQKCLDHLDKIMQSTQVK
ncbi:MAG: hypothetical protein GY869_20305 [Planctomycetes bacterium]|nr:hypothetical protein [Planctomycetota bacterium]